MAKTPRQGTFPGMDRSIARDDHASSVDVVDERAFGASVAEDDGPSNGDHGVLTDDEEHGLHRPASLKGQTVWVVDANSLIFQVFHALPEMTSPQGEPVSAVF